MLPPRTMLGVRYQCVRTQRAADDFEIAGTRTHAALHSTVTTDSLLIVDQWGSTQLGRPRNFSSIT